MANNKSITCLGIESTAHTFGIGIVKSDGSIIANARDAFTTEKGGIDPSKAREHHEKCKDIVLEKALKQARIKIGDVDIIAFSQGPGLPPCLVVGMEFAKKLSTEVHKPLVGINHCVAHLEIAKITTGTKDPVLLYTSGANTQVIAYEGNKYRIFGETLDQGIGNVLDQFARCLGLGFPGGPKIEKMAATSNRLIELPYSVKGMDVSYSGLITNLKNKADSGKFKKEDLCYSFQETAFAMLIEVTERAMAHCNKQELALGGGVACNKRLQEMCETMCKERDAGFFCPEPGLLVDNGAMIAWNGILAARSSAKAPDNPDEIDIKPKWRTDQVQGTWNSAT